MGIPIQMVSADVLREKYAKKDECGIGEIQRRVASATAAKESDSSGWADRFLKCLESGFIPGGRINSAAGTEIMATLISCFVQPIGDSMTEIDHDTGKVSITTALAEAAETMRRGGGVGYGFSTIRPCGAKVKGTHSQASGPLSYMRLLDSMCQTVESAGARRGAQMGVLRCDHPDIEAFVDAKAKPYAEKDLKHFNLSVGATDAFMEAVENDAQWQLVHRAEPSEDLIAAGAFRRDDGMWVYKLVQARDLWEQIMRATYGFADPGVLFIDRINEKNNLWYCEVIEAPNPCGEQPLPDYGCCCLGSLNLTMFVRDAFGEAAYFDMAAFKDEVAVAVRMLDNVLDITTWPLEKQAKEAAAKRRIGLGFMGLGDALIMMGLKYDSATAREMAASIAEGMRDAAYLASVDLAKEKGHFQMLDVEKYLQGGFMEEMPEAIKDEIRKHGIRNSHLLSLAPTGTISLAFGNGCSSGIEPPFSWAYNRFVRQPDGTRKSYQVYDYAFLTRKESAGFKDMSDAELVQGLPDHWVTAMSISAKDHAAMCAAVAPYIDSAISKTINVPEDYPYVDFVDIYMDAWRKGLKGITTYRPNSQLESVLSVPATESPAKADFDDSDPDRRIRVQEVPRPALGSLKWRSRPQFCAGNSAWTYMVKHHLGSFAVMVGESDNGDRKPFECWVNGAEVPRGLGAIAKSLSMDMRTKDGDFLKRVLESLIKTIGDDGFDMAMPPDGRVVRVPSMVSGFAQIVKYRCEVLGAFDVTEDGDSQVVLLSPKEPKTTTQGTMSWTVDIHNHATGDDFVMGMKELVLPSGQRRPYSVWLSGVYPRVLDGLCKVLSYDMRVVDPAWVGAKLRQLLDFPEFRGEFFAKEPLSAKSRNWPSTVAYMARLMVHRYAMLGILDEEGFTMEAMGVMTVVDGDGLENVVELNQYREPARSVGAMEVQPGKRCPECGNYSMIRKDGCDFCTSCGATGSCG